MSMFLLQLPFWNGCDEDDHCVPDLVIQSQTDLISHKYEHIIPPTYPHTYKTYQFQKCPQTSSLLYIRQFCGQVFRVSSALCLSQTEPEDTERVIEASRKKMVVDVRLENRGENAYGAQLNISYSRNLQFSSLIVKVRHWKGLKLYQIQQCVLREVEMQNKKVTIRLL